MNKSSKTFKNSNEKMHARAEYVNHSFRFTVDEDNDVYDWKTATCDCNKNAVERAYAKLMEAGDNDEDTSDEDQDSTYTIVRYCTDIFLEDPPSDEIQEQAGGQCFGETMVWLYGILNGEQPRSVTGYNQTVLEWTLAHKRSTSTPYETIAGLTLVQHFYINQTLQECKDILRKPGSYSVDVSYHIIGIHISASNTGCYAIDSARNGEYYIPTAPALLSFFQGLAGMETYGEHLSVRKYKN